MMKRFSKQLLGALLVLTMVVTIVPFGAVRVAAETELPSIQLSNVTGTANNDVVVSLTIPLNLGLAAGEFLISYNNTELTYKSHAKGFGLGGVNASFNPTFTGSGSSSDPDIATMAYAVALPGGINSAGSLIDITLTVKPGWTGTSTVTLTILDLYRDDLSEISVVAINGSVTVGAPGTPFHFYVPGDIIKFGSYPQTEVTNSSLINKLNAQTLGADNTVKFAGSKYKKVLFTTETNSYQATNGYNINTVYWFKFDPIQWRVLSNKTASCLCWRKKFWIQKHITRSLRVLHGKPAPYVHGLIIIFITPPFHLPKKHK